jgi:hypothetical protein
VPPRQGKPEGGVSPRAARMRKATIAHYREQSRADRAGADYDFEDSHNEQVPGSASTHTDSSSPSRFPPGSGPVTSRSACPSARCRRGASRCLAAAVGRARATRRAQSRGGLAGDAKGRRLAGCSRAVGPMNRTAASVGLRCVPRAAGRRNDRTRGKLQAWQGTRSCKLRNEPPETHLATIPGAACCVNAPAETLRGTAFQPDSRACSPHLAIALAASAHRG